MQSAKAHVQTIAGMLLRQQSQPLHITLLCLMLEQKQLLGWDSSSTKEKITKHEGMEDSKLRM